MNSKRPNVMKSTVRAGAGGAIVIAALFALMFMSGGGGPPSSESETPAETPSETPSETPMVTTDTEPVMTDAPATFPVESDSSGGLTADEKKAMSGNVLSILVDEWSYLMAVPTDTELIYRPAELNRLVELAQLTDGDSNGIRVRILQRETARISANEDLKTRLERVGISADAIYLQSEFIP